MLPTVIPATGTTILATGQNFFVLSEAAMVPPSSPTTPDLTHISEAAWSKARKRLTAIQPLLTAENISKEAAKQYAETVGVHVSTLYRWLEAYRKTEQLMALLPGKDRSESAIGTDSPSPQQRHSTVGGPYASRNNSG